MKLSKTMASVIRYFAWNAIVIGGLVLATVFNVKAVISILEVFFALEALLYIFFCFSGDKVLKKLAEANNAFKVYKIPFEMLFVALAFYLKHYFIGICMSATFFAYIFLFASTAQYRGIETKEESTVEKSS